MNTHASPHIPPEFSCNVALKGPFFLYIFSFSSSNTSIFIFILGVTAMAIENRGPELQVILSILLVIAVVVVALRCYIRIWLVKSFGIDDWFMVVALVSCLLSSVASWF